VTDEKSITKPIPASVVEKDLASYWLSAAVSAERMLQVAIQEADGDIVALGRLVRGVDSYLRVREKIGSMVEKAVCVSGEQGWDPFGPDPLEAKLDEAQARSQFDGVSATTVSLGLSHMEGDNTPIERDAVRLYKSGLTMGGVVKKTGLSIYQVRKALKRAGVKRARKKDRVAPSGTQ
jgi:hypothetical protein